MLIGLCSVITVLVVCKIFCVNINMLNVEEIIEQTVSEKIENIMKIA